MMGEDDPVQHCILAEPVNLHKVLDAAAAQYLDIDEQRSIVIYQQAILMVIATEGQATAAREFDVELWKEPPTEPDRDPDSLLEAFIDELVATTETVRR